MIGENQDAPIGVVNVGNGPRQMRPHLGQGEDSLLVGNSPFGTGQAVIKS